LSPRAWLWTIALAALGCRASAPETRADDLDSDGDHIPDVADRCPETREDPDGFEDWDGCPETERRDTDADGVSDDIDRCPREGEDRDGFEDSDGCPELDNDKDRVLDAEDKCPNDPENYNTVDDEDGCPDRTSGPSTHR
jgi:hypothetical protein